MKRILYIISVALAIFQSSSLTVAQQPSVYEVKKMSFNSNDFSDISPVIVKDNIIFCSDRRYSGITDRTSFDGHRLYNFYIANKKDTSGQVIPEELKSDRSFLFNNGPLAIASDGKTVYFTSEVETGKASKKRNFKNHNGIFIAELSGTNLTSVRPFKYNNPQYNIGQPSVSRDGKYLFFSSDMPGGQGGSDLYYCELTDGEWGNPVNMGPAINSPASENYPYMHPSSKLYFTSNRPGGFGNLDVYATTFANGKWEDPVILPEPINSASDDFAFVAEENLQTGYFASNRQKDDDIYRFSSTIIRKASCDTLVENSYCYRFFEENAVKSDSMPFRYEWKFGDGEKAIGPLVEHCYSGPGTYLVQLDVVNLITKEVMYNEKSDTLVLTEIEQPYITGPDSIEAGQRVEMNAEKTNLPGWKIERYYWNFGDETIAVGRNIDKTYFKPGTYNIQLIVTTEPEPGGVVREACICKNIIVFLKP
ncbi:MAG TPA: PKD domain-containing protein [Bacteroidales bacterium]|nr:PKD domain-containing protein [Bacteroidales bacterium]